MHTVCQEYTVVYKIYLFYRGIQNSILLGQTNIGRFQL
jgi:hypothetical protein